jgi:hypothetical protein
MHNINPMMIDFGEIIMKLIVQVTSVESKPLTHTKLAIVSFTNHRVEHEMVQLKGQGNDEMLPCLKSS